MITITTLGSVQNGNVSIGSIALNATTATSGSFLIAFIECRETETVPLTPSGWTLFSEIVGNGDNGNDPRLRIYTKIADAVETTYTWTFSANTYGSGGLIQVAGAEPSTLIHEIALGENANISTFTVPSVTTQFDESAAIAVAGVAATNYIYPFTPPTDYTEIIDTGGDGATNGRRGALAVSWKTYPTAGATGPLTYTESNGTGVQWAIAHMAIAPAGSLPDNPPATPTGLIATPGNATILLNWNDNTEPDLNADSPYQYRIATLADMSNAGAPVVVDQSEVLIEGLTNGTTYWMQVRAQDAINQFSGWSSPVSATPTAPALPGSWGMDIGLS